MAAETLKKSQDVLSFWFMSRLCLQLKLMEIHEVQAGAAGLKACPFNIYEKHSWNIIGARQV